MSHGEEAEELKGCEGEEATLPRFLESQGEETSQPRVSFETSFDSKLSKLEPKLDPAQNVYFASILKQRVSMF